MVQNAGRTHRTQHAQNGQPREGGAATESRFEALVAEQIADGKLKEGAIESLSSEIASLSSPRERAHQKNELRRAIRHNPDLSPADRREAIVSLNQSLAKMARAGTAQVPADTAAVAANPSESEAVARTLGTDAELGAEVKIDAAANRIRNSAFMLSKLPVRA